MCAFTKALTQRPFKCVTLTLLGAAAGGMGVPGGVAVLGRVAPLWPLEQRGLWVLLSWGRGAQ